MSNTGFLSFQIVMALAGLVAGVIVLNRVMILEFRKLSLKIWMKVILHILVSVLGAFLGAVSGYFAGMLILFFVFLVKSGIHWFLVKVL